MGGGGGRGTKLSSLISLLSCTHIMYSNIPSSPCTHHHVHTSPCAHITTCTHHHVHTSPHAHITTCTHHHVHASPCAHSCVVCHFSSVLCGCDGATDVDSDTHCLCAVGHCHFSLTGQLHETSVLPQQRR